jgi:hypothetical protein
MPHEMMYPHKRNYYNYDYSTAFYGSGASLNKTSVVWQSGASHYAPLPFTRAGLSKLAYKVQASKYCLDGNCAQQAVAQKKAQWAAARRVQRLWNRLASRQWTVDRAVALGVREVVSANIVLP